MLLQSTQNNQRIEKFIQRIQQNDDSLTEVNTNEGELKGHIFKDDELKNLFSVLINNSNVIEIDIQNDESIMSHVWNEFMLGRGDGWNSFCNMLKYNRGIHKLEMDANLLPDAALHQLSSVLT